MAAAQDEDDDFEFTVIGGGTKAAGKPKQAGPPKISDIKPEVLDAGATNIAAEAQNQQITGAAANFSPFKN